MINSELITFFQLPVNKWSITNGIGQNECYNCALKGGWTKPTSPRAKLFLVVKSNQSPSIVITTLQTLKYTWFTMIITIFIIMSWIMRVVEVKTIAILISSLHFNLCKPAKVFRLVNFFINKNSHSNCINSKVQFAFFPPSHFLTRTNYCTWYLSLPLCYFSLKSNWI